MDACLNLPMHIAGKRSMRATAAAVDATLTTRKSQDSNDTNTEEAEHKQTIESAIEDVRSQLKQADYHSFYLSSCFADADAMVRHLERALHSAKNLARSLFYKQYERNRCDNSTAVSRHALAKGLHECWCDTVEQWTGAVQTIILQRILPIIAMDDNPSSGFVLRLDDVLLWGSLHVKATSNDVPYAAEILLHLATTLREVYTRVQQYSHFLPTVLRDALFCPSYFANDCCTVIVQYLLV